MIGILIAVDLIKGDRDRLTYKGDRLRELKIRVIKGSNSRDFDN